MNARPIYIAALPREISGIVNGWRADETLLIRKINLFWNDHAIVACAGMGADRARLAVEAALKLGPASELISVGWAGACNPTSGVGDVLHPTIVIDAKTGERFFSAELEQKLAAQRPVTHQILVTVPVPADIPAKQRLSVTYYALAVDMEAAAVARLARAREIPFSAIKAISDAADFELPDLSRFTTPDGQLREAAFGLHVALRPSMWKPVMTMARGSKLAADRLQQAIRANIAQHRTNLA